MGALETGVSCLGSSCLGSFMRLVVGMVSQEVKAMTTVIEDIDIDTLFARVDKKNKNALNPEDAAGLDRDGNALVTDDFHDHLVADDNPGDPAQTANDDTDAASDVEAQQVTVEALASVLPELREHLVRTVAWVDEVMAALEVSRGR